MKNLLWLDDLRNPFLNLENKVPLDENQELYNINWVINYEQFTQWINMYGLPDAISFDHDLGDAYFVPEEYWNSPEESEKFKEWKNKFHKEKTGMDCAKWLVDYCLNKKKSTPRIFVHSSNTVGANNILSLMDSFSKFLKEKNG